MRAPDISVVVATYNRAQMLPRALESLTCQDTGGRFTYEIVVIDNGSTDETRQVVEDAARRSEFPIRYLYEERQGVAYARNRGVKETRSKWIATFDDDQLAARDWLTELLAVALETGAQVVAGSVRLALSQDELSGLGRIGRTALGEHRHYDQPRRCQRNVFLGAGNVLFERSVFDSIGSFDTSMRVAGSEADFVLTAREEGFDIWYAPEAVIHHRVPPYRLKTDYFRWLMLRYGSTHADHNRKHGGWGVMLLGCVARIAKALLVTLPFLLMAYVKRNEAEVRGRQCLLWRVVGYTRGTLFLLAPKIFPQERFFATLELRNERKYFAASTPT